jgi:hypothetical protein
MNPEDEDEDQGYQEWLAEKNRWLGRIGDFPTTPVDPLYQRNLMTAADGGRIGYADGTGSRNKMSALMFKLSNGTITGEEMIELRNLQSSSGISFFDL